MTAGMIAIRGLAYTYPGRRQPSLDGIHLTVKPGEFVLLTGASGSGKSTLLRCLNGLVPHFTGGQITGQIRVHGLDPVASGPPGLSRHVGFVHQVPEAQSVLDRVEAEIAFGLENAGTPAAEMDQRVTDVMDLLDLTPLRRRLLHTLSGGERQKVAIAAALALQPALLVLDEPTSQLDPEAAADLLDALSRLHRSLDLTLVLAEQRLERVLANVTRVIHLANGRIVLDGPTRAVAQHHPFAPPVVRLGRDHDWQPIPLDVAEAHAFLPATPILAPAPGGNGSEPAAMMGAPAPVLQVSALTFAYERQPVLDDVDLQVAPGEVVALLGPNGAGKSTLLRCLVGLLPPQLGEVTVAGRAIAGRSVADICRQVAYLPQNPDDLLFAEDVAAELAVTMQNHHLPADPPRIQRHLESLGLAEVADAYPRDLSVGQRQRVALAAVTITDPVLILLDEPTRGLDAAAKADLLSLCRAWRRQQKGVLLVTHDVELATQIAGRVVLLEQGRIAADGPVADVFARYPAFASQIARLFPGTGWLNLADVQLPAARPVTAARMPGSTSTRNSED